MAIINTSTNMTIHALHQIVRMAAVTLQQLSKIVVASCYEVGILLFGANIFGLRGS